MTKFYCADNIYVFVFQYLAVKIFVRFFMNRLTTLFLFQILMKMLMQDMMS
jgi:hypothetical protein